MKWSQASATILLLLLLLCDRVAKVEGQTCPSNILLAAVLGTFFSTVVVALLVVLIVCLVLRHRHKSISKSETKHEAREVHKQDVKLNHNGRATIELTAAESARNGYSGYVRCRENTMDFGKELENFLDNTSLTYGAGNVDGPPVVFSTPNCPVECTPLPRDQINSRTPASRDPTITLSHADPQPTKIVRVLLRSQDVVGLGFSITSSADGRIFVSDVPNKGPAHESGLIKTGDRIVSLSVSMDHIIFEDAMTILSYASPYPIELELETCDPPSVVDSMQQRANVACIINERKEDDVFLNKHHMVHPLWLSRSHEHLHLAEENFVEPDEIIARKKTWSDWKGRIKPLSREQSELMHRQWLDQDSKPASAPLDRSNECDSTMQLDESSLSSQLTNEKDVPIDEVIVKDVTLYTESADRHFAKSLGPQNLENKMYGIPEPVAENSTELIDSTEINSTTCINMADTTLNKTAINSNGTEAEMRNEQSQIETVRQSDEMNDRINEEKTNGDFHGSMKDLEELSRAKLVQKMKSITESYSWMGGNRTNINGRRQQGDSSRFSDKMSQQTSIPRRLSKDSSKSIDNSTTDERKWEINVLSSPPKRRKMNASSLPDNLEDQEDAWRAHLDAIDRLAKEVSKKPKSNSPVIKRKAPGGISFVVDTVLKEKNTTNAPYKPPSYYIAPSPDQYDWQQNIRQATGLEKRRPVTLEAPYPPRAINY